VSGSDVVPRRFDASVFVAAPRTVVFDYFADPRNRPEWQASLATIELLDPLAPEQAPYVGLRWVDRVKVGPPFELQISRLEPDRLWSEVGAAGPFTAYGTLLFDDETRDGADGTRVHCIARVHGRGVARPLGPAATALAVALVRVDLGRAARILSGRAVGGTG
jgi:uncharacterized protein YndB with AHSA1/START domain